MRPLLFAALLTSLGAQAHEGHGLAGASHWHATDTWGLLIALAVIGLGWLISRK